MRKTSFWPKMPSWLSVACLLTLTLLPLKAQETELLARYDENNSELEGHCTMLLSLIHI